MSLTKFYFVIAFLMIVTSAKAQSVLRSGNQDFAEAETLVQNGRWSEAVKVYNTLIPDRHFYEAFHNRGIARLKLHDTAGYCIDSHNAAFLRDSIQLAFESPYCVTTQNIYFNSHSEIQTDTTGYVFREVIRTSRLSGDQLVERFDAGGVCIARQVVINAKDTVLLDSKTSRRAKFSDQKHFLKNIRYPAFARENDVQGTTLTGLLVDDQGKILRAESLLGEKHLADESVRVIKMIGKFPAATRNGKPVSSYVIVPVTFLVSTK